MTYSVKITNQAEKDLRNIYMYIAYELQSVQNAAAQLARLEENICGLDQMPERYRRYEREPWYSRGWRIVPDFEHKVVNITRILYGGRDIGIILANSEKI